MSENPRAFEQTPEPEDEPATSEQPPEWDDEPGVFEVYDAEAEAAADARAEADIAAGRYYEHAVVGEWLKTWGKPGRLTFHDWLKQVRQ